MAIKNHDMEIQGFRWAEIASTGTVGELINMPLLIHICYLKNCSSLWQASVH